jgi:EpsI family protein
VTPIQRQAAQRPQVDLEAMIPAQFGGWRVTGDLVPLQASPDLAARLDELYSQVLARTYVDAGNRRVMLSIAYGGDQLSDRTQVHRPENCYAGQGFAIRRIRDESLATGVGAIPVRRLFAQRGARREPVSYWITIGDDAMLPGLERKLAQLRLGLGGTIPDGMLVRVSSLDSDAEAGYALQDRFLRELLGAMAPAARARLVGAPRPDAEVPGRGRG